jgi:hypothetical protein
VVKVNNKSVQEEEEGEKIKSSEITFKVAKSELVRI